ncbi:hypothetical protein ECZU34_64490 [Escherichia coli]|nr:hypothetical protein ECZU34_64490 [Escherichia coli]
MLLSAILGDAINLGLTKMAESSPGLTYAKLSRLQAASATKPIRRPWPSWSTTSIATPLPPTGATARPHPPMASASARVAGASTGHVNQYGSEPGRLFYTHISDQYAPFSTRVVNVGVRDSTYVLDGLLYHESDLRIEEHYTDTAGFTDHVFALMHLLGFRFAPRIRDLGETKLYVPQGVQNTDVAPADRRHPEHQARACPLGRHPAHGQLDQAGHRHRLADAAQARQLPAPERTGRGPARAGRIERTLFIWTGCKVLNCAAACMPA